MNNEQQQPSDRAIGQAFREAFNACCAAGERPTMIGVHFVESRAAEIDAAEPQSAEPAAETEILSEWRAAGGWTHGPIVDHAVMAVEDYIQFRRKLYTHPPAPAAAGLHPATADLVQRFAAALAEKLAAAERKYGYSDGWRSPDWLDECRAKLVEHVAKGDPRDVAAYCAFLWHHGDSTVLPAAAVPDGWVLVPAECTDAMVAASCDPACLDDDDVSAMWRAMLAAAPKPEPRS